MSFPCGLFFSELKSWDGERYGALQNEILHPASGRYWPRSLISFKVSLQKTTVAFTKNPPAPVGAKGRVFPEALAIGSFSWGGGGAPFSAGKTHGTFIKHCNLQHFGSQTASPTFWP